jgi:hypothetical protein
MLEQQGIDNKHRNLCILQKFLNNHIQQDKILLKRLINIHRQEEKLINHYLKNKKQAAEEVKVKRLLKDFKKVRIKSKLKKNLNNILKMYKILQNNLLHFQQQNQLILQIELKVKEMILKDHLRKNHKFLNFKLKNKRNNKENTNYKMKKWN